MLLRERQTLQPEEVTVTQVAEVQVVEVQVAEVQAVPVEELEVAVASEEVVPVVKGVVVHLGVLQGLAQGDPLH